MLQFTHRQPSMTEVLTHTKTQLEESGQGLRTIMYIIVNRHHLYSAFIQSAVHLYSAFIQSAVHLYSAFIQSTVQSMPLIHTHIHTPTAIGCHARYQPARQEQSGVRRLAQGHFDTPRVGSNRQPSDCQTTALTSRFNPINKHPLCGPGALPLPDALSAHFPLQTKKGVLLFSPESAKGTRQQSSETGGSKRPPGHGIFKKPSNIQPDASGPNNGA